MTTKAKSENKNTKTAEEMQKAPYFVPSSIVDQELRRSKELRGNTIALDKGETFHANKSSWKPAVGEKCLFTNKYNEFVATIDSFDPLVVTAYTIKGGCQSDSELSINSLDEYTITFLSKDDAFRRLAMA